MDKLKDKIFDSPTMMVALATAFVSMCAFIVNFAIYLKYIPYFSFYNIDKTFFYVSQHDSFSMISYAAIVIVSIMYSGFAIYEEEKIYNCKVDIKLLTMQQEIMCEEYDKFKNGNSDKFNNKYLDKLYKISYLLEDLDEENKTKSIFKRFLPVILSSFVVLMVLNIILVSNLAIAFISTILYIVIYCVLGCLSIRKGIKKYKKSIYNNSEYEYRLKKHIEEITFRNEELDSKKIDDKSERIDWIRVFIFIFTVVFTLLFYSYLTGMAESRSRKEYNIVELGKKNYAIVYISNDIVVLDEAVIDDDVLIINTKNQKLISVAETESTKKEFRKIETQ